MKKKWGGGTFARKENEGNEAKGGLWDRPTPKVPAASYALVPKGGKGGHGKKEVVKLRQKEKEKVVEPGLPGNKKK